MFTVAELTDRRNANLTKARTIIDAEKSRGLTSGEQAEAETLLKAVHADNDAIKSRKASKASMDELEGWLSDGRESDDVGPGQGKSRPTFARFAKNLSQNAVQGFKDAGGHAKAATVATNPLGSFVGGTSAGIVDSALPPDPALGLLGLIHQQTQNGGNQFAYFQEDSNSSSAAVVPDGQKKPVSSKKLIEKIDQMKVLAHLSTPLVNRMLSDHADFGRYLETVMSRDLIALINQEILTGNGEADHLLGLENIEGVLEQAALADLPSTLRAARTKLQVQNETPDAWVISAADSERIDLYSDLSERFMSLREIMGNLPVVVSPDLEAGTAYLGRFSHASLMTFGDAERGGIQLRATDSMPFDTGEVDAEDNPIYNGDLFSRNLFCIRAEMRVGGLAVSRPQAFVKIAIPAV